MRTAWRFGFVLGALVLGLLALGVPAQAHPLGNFTVNHYDGLVVRPDGVDVRAVVDSAELPTAQELPLVDTDSDGQMSGQELSAFAAVRCPEVAAAVRASAGEAALVFTVTGSAAETVPGAAALPTLRVSCELTAPADFASPTTLTYANGFRADRVGWHEITVRGDGVRTDAPVPTESISDELRTYPGDLLSSPLDVRSVVVEVAPGAGGRAGTFALPSGGGDPVSRVVAQADRSLQELVGRDLTPLVGGLAVLLALLLGAGHALLPGHGKTVMAAYLAGKRGSRRDAVTVGATVTITHTAGVLVLGVLITAAGSFAGEQALRWLGIVSGALVAAIGVGLLRSAVRERRQRAVAPVDELALVGAGGPATGHGHGHGHGHGQGQGGYSRRGLVGMGIAGGLVPSPSATVVLVASIALNRTLFGVVLVSVYGLGMAATLTAVGLLLVRMRGRLDAAATTSRIAVRAGGAVRRLAVVLPVLTAALVLVVGLGLVVRGLVLPY